MSGCSFSPLHALVNEKSEFFSNSRVYYPSETPVAQSSLYIGRTELDVDKTSGLNTIPVNDPPPQTPTDATTGSTLSDSDISEHSDLPVFSPAPDSFIISNPTMVQMKQIYPSLVFVFRIMSYDPTTRPIKNICHLTKYLIRSDIIDTRISHRLLAACWEIVATKSHENPHVRP